MGGATQHIYEADQYERDMFHLLRCMGITRVTFQFSGGGDQGQIDQVTVEGIHESLYPTLEVPDDFYAVHGAKSDYAPAYRNSKLSNAIEAFGDWYLEYDRCGYDWYNNDGGQGTLTLTPSTNSAHLDISINVTTTEEFEEELGSLVTDEGNSEGVNGGTNG